MSILHVKFLKYGFLKKSPIVLGCPMPYPTLGNKSRNFHFLNVHKDFILSKLFIFSSSSEDGYPDKINHTLQVKIKVSKYHPMNFHWSFSAQLTDPLQHASCVTQNFNLKNIHRKEKSSQKSQWWVVRARRVEVQKPNHCSIRKVSLRCNQF